MARWKKNGGSYWWRNNNGITMTANGEKDAGQPMLGWTEDQEDDYYLRPGLRFALAREKKQDRCLAILTFVAFFMLVVIGTCIIVLTTRHYVKPCTVCDSVESAMNLSVDPCQDFYEYTCGNWVANVKVPEGYSKWGTFGEVYSRNNDLLLKLLAEEGYEYNGNHSEALRKAKNYYHACMNVTAIEEAGSAPLKQLLNQLGGWSILPRNTPGIVDWDETSFDLTRDLTSIHLKDGSPLFDMGIAPDEKNSSVGIIQFVQDGIGFNAIELYSDNVTTHEEAYAALGAKVVLLLSLADDESVVLENITSHSSYAPALERMRNIVEFEANISKIYMPKNLVRDPSKTYTKVTVKEFADIIPQINMTYYLNEMFATAISPDRKILVPTFSYFVKLNDLLKQTDKRTLADYLTWNAVKPTLRFLPKIYEDIILKYSSVFSGSNTTVPLWQKCLQRTDNTFTFVTGALFVREVVTPQLKNETQDLIHYIQDAFIGNLPNVTWMDDATKEAAEEKAYAIKPKIGFPDWIEDTVQLDAYFKDINITATSVFQNAMNVGHYSLLYLRDLLDKPVDKNEWHMGPSEVNAYYSATFNEIVFPSGILQAPFYDVSRPMSMNFGGIGMVMGHELTHGFDNHGREFDKDGNLRDWWGNASAVAYKNKTDCMVDQYSSYKIGDKHVDGVFTLGENIADNGGLKLAYQAYQQWRETFNDTMGLLSGLGMSQDQLFFVGFSQVWCSYATPQSAEMSILTDTHTAEKFRVNGAVSNMPVFSDVFNCPSGTPMNPKKKCEVW
ncbi:endothelin-converting enzyme 1 [Strongylocentrotus purpuratus]|uniref:Endothelin-converting enzyme 1 n=1 Tax=Strongylocentrotus purpuratus TaxID=7668 RepID=A0A7M7NY20_STRPU|nr:endothelin-converting enzyme 1 [Strongylocentrotus purpuratus]|eukprot:XP_001191766.2 PREDICTED: endothelin-converting enzyme 1 [Strongylocentrotus purpuratus]